MLPIISNKVFLGYSYPSSLLTSEIIMPRQNPAAPQTFHLETPLLAARYYNSLLVLHRFFYLATDRRKPTPIYDDLQPIPNFLRTSRTQMGYRSSKPLLS